MKKLMALNSICTDVFVEENEIRLGGESLNFCGNACNKENIECYLLGAVGTDEYGRKALEKLSSYPINTEYLHVIHGTTASNKIYLTKEGDRYFKEDSWDGGVYQNYHLTAEDLKGIKSMDCVHTLLTSPVFNEVLALKRESEFLLSVDFDDLRDFDAWEEMLQDIDIFFISGSPEILPRLKTWSQKYYTVFVATLAADGSVAYHHGKEYRAQAVRVEKIYDTTGCGDSYQAAFMASYCQDKDLNKAMLEGSLQASKTLSHFGGF